MCVKVKSNVSMTFQDNVTIYMLSEYQNSPTLCRVTILTSESNHLIVNELMGKSHRLTYVTATNKLSMLRLEWILNI